MGGGQFVLDLEVKKIDHDNKEYYVMKHNRSIVSGGYLSNIVKSITAKRLNRIADLGGKIIFIKGRNVITFKNEHSALMTIDYLNSIRILELLH